MSMIEFYSAEDYEHAAQVVSGVLEDKMRSGILNVPFDMMTGSRKAVLNALSMDIVSVLARSDIAREVPISGDIGDMPGVEVERVTG